MAITEYKFTDVSSRIDDKEQTKKLIERTIEEIDLSNYNIKSIKCTFANCKNLKKVILPKDITEIDLWAFKGCSSLTSIIIPNSVSIIGDFAFDGCKSLTEFRYTGTMEQWNSIILESSWKLGAPFTEVVCSDGVLNV